MHRFLTNNRDELISRCKAKVAERPRRAATEEQLRNGVPLFLKQLTRTLQAEEDGEAWESLRISGASGGDMGSLSEMGLTATAHGKELLVLGYTVDQVVHDYGDLCQAITDMAFENDAPFTVDEFRTLNRCLDNAIADAVSSFTGERDVDLLVKHTEDANLRLAYLVHELRNSVVSAKLAASALEKGNLSMSGATGGVLKRSLDALGKLIGQTLAEVQMTNSLLMQDELFSVATLMSDLRDGAVQEAKTKGCAIVMPEVDPLLGIEGNRSHLMAALAHLLQNAVSLTHGHSEVTLHAYAEGNRVLIDIKDNRGGLSPADVQRMFLPYAQRSDGKGELGLKLSMAKESVEADGGSLTVRDVTGTGCVFTISLPRHALH